MILFVLLFADKLFPSSCSFLVTKHNEKCLGQNSTQQLAICMSTGLTNSTTRECYDDYQKYLNQVANSTEKFVSEKIPVDNDSFFLKSEPVLTPAEIDQKVGEFNRDRCTLNKRGFMNGIKVAWRNISMLLYYSLQFIHWLVYITLGLVYAAFAFFASAIIESRFIVSKEFFERFGCLFNSMMDFFVKKTSWIAPWTYWSNKNTKD
eukprot:NODE_108_length_18904_cov_0.654826.p11 type:complete len:206 gc:universal NODE_108_length_18904_cov_0.654826:4112-3495(-)